MTLSSSMLDATDFRTLLAQASGRFGTQPFLLDDERLGAVSYGDVWAFALGIELQLDELDIDAGAPVAVLLHNCGLAALLFLSVMASRRVLVPINPISTDSELAHMLSLADCAAIIVDPEHVLSKGYGKRKVVSIDDHAKYYAERRERGSTITDTRGATPGSVFVGEVVFTSGSTGRSKGVLLSEGSLISNARALAGAYRLEATDRFLTVCPLFHNSGQVFTTLACLLVGGSTIPIKSAAGMLHFWSFVDKYRATWSLAMVSFLALLLARNEEPHRPTTMRGLLTGGSAIDGALIQRFETRFEVPVRTIYGLTETASISTCEHLDPSPRSVGSSGRPLPICTVKIVPAKNEAFPGGQGASSRAGEILISGSNVFDSYVRDPALTRQRKVDGWVHTGDLGYFDDHGNLFVVDRLDSMLIVGGENVYPAEVETLCASLPGAAQIVLAGIDHPIWGKELILVYKAHSGVRPSLDSWQSTLQHHVSAVKLPRRYASLQELGVSDFPRLENGKLDRHAINALVKRWTTTPR